MTADATVRKDIEIVNQRGLHARAAAKFVRAAEQFDAVVTVSKDGTSVPGTSILGLMMLAASPGTIIHLEATGRERREVIDALATLVEEHFDEDPSAPD